jgi:lysophospholipase L1-like esterase
VPFPNGTVAHVNALGYRGPAVALTKPAGTYRVVLLGGSTTHGFLVGDEDTIDAHLRRLLAAGRPVEVVNLGLEGLDAISDLERLRLEGLRLAPDAVVVHTGVNDVLALRYDRLDANDPARGFRAERRRAEEARVRAHGPWAALKHAVLLARVPGIVRDLTAQRATVLPGPSEPSAPALAAFATTIRTIAASVPATTKVVLSTPPTTALPPGAAAQCGSLVVDAATTARYRVALDATLRRVAGELASAGRRVTYVAHAPLDRALFFDECHPTGAGNRQIAADLAAVLSRDADGGRSDAR